MLAEPQISCVQDDFLAHYIIKLHSCMSNLRAQNLCEIIPNSCRFLSHCIIVCMPRVSVMNISWEKKLHAE